MAPAAEHSRCTYCDLQCLRLHLWPADSDACCRGRFALSHHNCPALSEFKREHLSQRADMFTFFLLLHVYYCVAPRETPLQERQRKRGRTSVTRRRRRR